MEKRFIRCVQTYYNKLDSNERVGKIFFVIDTKRIYLGNVQYIISREREIDIVNKDRIERSKKRKQMLNIIKL